LIIADGAEGVFKVRSLAKDKNAILEILKNNPKELKKIDADPRLIAEAITELGQSYFYLKAKKKLAHGKGSEMKIALKELQDVFAWIVENREKTEMCWTSLMISVPSLFKLMKAENQIIHYKNADAVEKDFLNLVLAKLSENPSSVREQMLFPIMNKFAKATPEKKQQILDSLKTIGL